MPSGGDIDTMLITPNGRTHSHLTKLAFENLGHPFQPFVHGQKVIGPKIAKKMNIKRFILMSANGVKKDGNEKYIEIGESDRMTLKFIKQ